MKAGVDEVGEYVPFGPTVAVNHPDDDDINVNDDDTAVVIGPGSFHANSCGEPS